MEVTPDPASALVVILGLGLGSLGALGCIVFGILTGVKILEKFGQGPGVVAIVLALLCNIGTFIWGWVKAGELGIQKLMKWYTVALVVGAVGWFIYLAGGAMFVRSAYPGGLEQILEDAAAEAAAQEAARSAP